jgi:hypothetical protein
VWRLKHQGRQDGKPPAPSARKKEPDTEREIQQIQKGKRRKF